MDLEQIFRAHQKEIFVYFLRTVGDRHLAEDLSQETFLRACRGALLYRAEASLRTWLFTIARATLADYFRRKPPSTVPLAEERAEEQDPTRRVAIEEVLARLPVAQREALVLCDVLGFSPNEAATMVALNPNAFRVRLHRARQGFREVYGDER